MAQPNPYNPRGALIDSSGHPVNDGGASLPNNTIGPGARGIVVKELQAKLMRLGYKIAASGEFDGLTEQALRHFQAANKLPVSGVYGPQEEQALNSVMTRALGALGFGVGTKSAVGHVGSSQGPDGTWHPLQVGPTPNVSSLVAPTTPGAAITKAFATPAWSDLSLVQKGLMVAGVAGIAWAIYAAFNSKKGGIIAGVGLGGGVGAAKQCPRSPPPSAFEGGSVVKVS